MVFIIIAAAVIAAAFAALFAVYYKVFYAPHREAVAKLPPSLLRNPFKKESDRLVETIRALPCEFVNTRSYDGLTLSARYYHKADDRPLCICFHGYRGSALRDFSGGAQFLMREGYNVLLVDERAHGLSGGHTITYGLRERYDVLSWVNWANGRFGDKKSVYLFGISMGGGTVLMASGLDLPANVERVTADCPLDSPIEIILHVAKKMGFAPSIARPLVIASARIFGRLDICETTAADEVKKSKTPILIIHGEADDFVPAYMSARVRDANPSMVEMRTFPEAGHGLSYLYDPARYERILRDFLAARK